MMSEWLDITFANPWYFLLLLVIPAYLLLKSKLEGLTLVPFTFSSQRNKLPATWRTRVLSMLTYLRLLILLFLVVALARPQSGFSNRKVRTEGIDIVLALDISTSMYAIDFKPNRMEAAKAAAIEFIEERPSDRIGLVVFAGEAFTQCPVTLDHLMLTGLVEQADNWQLEDGTAIGDGLFMAVSRLSDSNAIGTRVIVLLTDGVRTAGEFSALDAARAAEQLNIRIYTIGVGSQTNRPIPVVDKSGINIYDLDPRISFDEESLEEIAAITGGQYFRATSAEKLKEIYQQIDQLEKQKVEVSVSERYEDRFALFVWIALALLTLELFFRLVVLKTLN